MNYDACMTMRTKPDHNATILAIIKSYVGDANKRTQLVRARNLNRNCLAEKARRREWEQLSLCEVS